MSAVQPQQAIYLTEVYGLGADTMAGISKRVDGAWVSGDERVMKTATDIIVPPTTIYADGNNATVGLKGNMSQSGTPTPTTPIQPQECGEKTPNILDKLKINPVTSSTLIEQVPNGVIIENVTSGYGGKISIDVTSNTQYCLSFEKEKISGNYSGYVTVFAGTGQSTVLASAYNTPKGTCTFNTGEYSKINIWFYISPNATGKIKFYDIMLNEGNEYLPYEPYGYKIPFSSANTTTPVYLGEVETTRKIKKVALTGNETGWGKSSSRVGSFYLSNSSLFSCVPNFGYCNVAQNAPRISEYSYGKMYFEFASLLNLWLFDTDITINDFLNYLQQQYTAGTPVTVWYVLATETTGIVNEPLRKIGDYADTVSGITIPTIAGANTLSVDTTLQPSEVTATYHGWREGTVKEYENGNWQPQAQALSLSNAPMLSDNLAFSELDEPVPVIEPGIEPEITE